jgi:uncharacterized FAD-dependent dehydrogenase
VKNYDAIIVGAGPAGIFTVLELTGKEGAKVLLLEKGEDIDQRSSLGNLDHSAEAGNRSVADLSGWGGAGMYSDGKLTLSPDVGGFLHNFIDEKELTPLMEYVDDSYLRFGAPEKVYGLDAEEVRKLQERAEKCDLKLVPTRIRHMGTDRCPQVLRNIKESLQDKVDIRFKTSVRDIVLERNKAVGVVDEKGEEYRGKFVVLAPGRQGAEWLSGVSEQLGLSTVSNPVDIGVRVELRGSVLKELTDVTYEPKLLFTSRHFDDRVRTFCMNPYGEVIKEVYNGVSTVNGHSLENGNSDNTNFAILVSTSFTEPFNEPISYGKYIARLANFLGEGVIVQRLGDLLKGRRSTEERIARGAVKPTLQEATPGDLSFVLPYRYLTDILEMLAAMDKLAPGVYSRHTLIYGVEVKFYSMKLALSSSMETQVQNLFAIGDGAGVSRGVVQSSASGVLAGKEILRRLG